MAKISQLEADVYVASQLVEEDFAMLADRGIRTVVSNRPDGEADDQLPSGRAAEAAVGHDLIFRYLPVASFDVTDDEPVAAQARALAELPRPILFYCRTGNRSTILWAQAAAPRLDTDTVLKCAGRAGFDLAELREFIDAPAGAMAA